ncbi:MAG: response regulator, partial [Clostridia bacterium]|nr:response regulator [Clostridia bacterium]
KNFVEMMDGDISVESEKGVGSEFTVTVALKQTDRRWSEENGIALPEGMRAIVVDNDEIACEHAQLVLESIGVHVERFTNAAEALERLESAFAQGAPYDLLLTDYKMPGMNGCELTRAVRGFDGGKTVVIMLTGYNWDIIEEEAKQDGVDSIIAKPLFPDTLMRTLQTTLEQKTGIQTAALQQEEEEEKENVLAGRRVLIAEDVDANAEILADMLDLEDIVSDRACNGREAVDMFASRPAGYYDMVLMDVRMPLMDGLSATKEIRALPRDDAREIPIVAMTANVFDEDVERSMEAGMNAHLSKPIEPERLYAEMAEQIKRRIRKNNS